MLQILQEIFKSHKMVVDPPPDDGGNFQNFQLQLSHAQGSHKSLNRHGGDEGGGSHYKQEMVFEEKAVRGCEGKEHETGDKQTGAETLEIGNHNHRRRSRRRKLKLLQRMVKEIKTMEAVGVSSLLRKIATNIGETVGVAEESDDDCCNSCEEVREAYRKKGWGMSNPDLIDQCKREGFLQRIKDEEGEGCNIYGFLDVNRVAGNFHFAPGKSFQQSNVHVHDLHAFQKDSFNVSHKINKLAFGDFFPGVVNPLDGVQWIQEAPYGMYQYFIKVVPSVYNDINGQKIQSNQFSVTEHFRADEVGRVQALPGVFFFYDLSPIKVTFTEAHVPFLHFLTNVCAIVGGIFTVSGILDAFVYHSQKAIKKKMEIGKFS